MDKDAIEKGEVLSRNLTLYTYFCKRCKQIKRTNIEETAAAGCCRRCSREALLEESMTPLL